MVKELEALNDLFDLVTCQGSFEKAQRCFDIVEEALHRLEAIDNANPSEALEVLCFMGGYIIPTANGNKYLKDFCNREFTTIKQALLKAQEPKHYLKWEDLEFTKYDKEHFVLVNGNKYSLKYYTNNMIGDIAMIYKGNRSTFLFDGRFPEDKQLFNDLKLEEVE